jgi:hypothetical protein
MVNTKMRQQKKFNGLNYTWALNLPTKKDAEYHAKGYRKNGYSMRITKINYKSSDHPNGIVVYALWYRRKR